MNPMHQFQLRLRGFCLMEPCQPRLYLPPVLMSSDVNLMSPRFLAGFSGLTVLVMGPVVLLPCRVISDWVAGMVNCFLLVPSVFAFVYIFLSFFQRCSEVSWTGFGPFRSGLCDLLGRPGAVVSPEILTCSPKPGTSPALWEA